MPARPSSHIDPRSPLVLDTRELGRRAGSMLEMHRSLDAPAGWGLELVTVPAGAPVELAIRLESVVDGVLATCELTAALTAECGRCLEPVTDTLDVSMSELFAYEPDPEDVEMPVLDGDLIDLAPLLRDAVVLALPLNPLCDEDCRGLCVGCGIKLDDLEPGHSHEALDPRWAALAPLNDTADGKSATMDPHTVNHVDASSQSTQSGASPSASSSREN